MIKKSAPIIFFGNEHLATGVTSNAPVIQALTDAGYNIRAVIIAQNKVEASRQHVESPIIKVANKLNIPVLSPSSLKNDIDLSTYNPELGILIAYGKIIPQKIIDLFPLGIINLHPSLLPAHRGPTPIERVILNGDHQTGMSLMKLTKEMDAGPIYDQQTIKLQGTESKQQLADQLLSLGTEMLLKNLPKILDDSLDPRPQATNNVSYDQLIKKNDGIIDQQPAGWNQSVEVLCRQIRAYYAWPRSKAKIKSHEIIITEAHCLKENIKSYKPGTIYTNNNILGIYGRDGIMIIDKLIPVGRKEMSSQAFLAGYKI